MSRDSLGRTILVATLLCLVCSFMVSVAAVSLRGYQQENKERERQRNILVAAGIYDANADIDELFQRVTPKIVDLSTGQYVDEGSFDTKDFDQRKAADDPKLSKRIAPDADIAGLGHREKFSYVYLVKDASGQVEQIVMPVKGKGLWSTLYGFLALDRDMQTIHGLTFYEHAETPGLGGEIDNPAWKAQWRGKLAFDEHGNLRIEVARGIVDPTQDQAKYQVDGLAGATLTSRGVSDLVRYWLGPDGFGSYLGRLRKQKVAVAAVWFRG